MNQDGLNQVKFDDEKSFLKWQKQKYKEDLDYLISLRKKLGEEEFQARYGKFFIEFQKRVHNMDDVQLILNLAIQF